MDHDDKTVGKILSRREVLKLLGAVGGTALLAGKMIQSSRSAKVLAQSTDSYSYLPFVQKSEATATPTFTSTPNPTATPSPTSAASPTPTPSCIVRPEQTEGPFFIDEVLNRSDIRSDPNTQVVEDGSLLEVTFNISRLTNNACTVFPNVKVDLWQCNALGAYSDVENQVGKKYLRGHQTTDSNGMAKFITIYPGSYPGRTVHLHFKLRVTVENQAYEFTSQLYFDDALTDQIHTQAPYSNNGARDTRNDDDFIFFQDNGSQLLLSATPAAEGHRADFNIALQI